MTTDPVVAAAPSPTGGVVRSAEAASVWVPSAAAERPAMSPRQLAGRRFRRNRLAMIGFVTIVILAIIAVLASVIAPYDPSRIDAKAFGKPPSAAHLLGTDASGRDML